MAYEMSKARKMVEGLTDIVEGVEADGLALALLPIYDLSSDPAAREAALNLIRVAYDVTTEADDSFFEYLNTLRGSMASPEVGSATATHSTTQSDNQRSADLLDSVASVYSEAAAALRRGDEGQIDTFRQGLRKLLDLLADDRQTADPREQATERYIELLDEYGNRDYVRAHLMRVLIVAEEAEGQEAFEREILTEAVALLLQSDDAPSQLHNALSDSLNEILEDTQANDALDPDNVRAWFPTALQRLKEKEQSRHEAVHLDSSGGELPPIPVSEALRDALNADAERCRREPVAHVAAILESYYEIGDSSLHQRKESDGGASEQ
jgi:hypothetical protein